MKYILNEKYLLEENNLLCEADDWNVGDGIKHNDKITKFLELLKKKQQEIKDFSDNFTNLMGIGFDVSKTINDIEGKYKPLAQKLDKLNNIIPDIIKKLKNISDETAQNNKSILSTIELLSKELDMLKLKEVSNAKQLDKLSHNLDATIDTIIKNLDSLNTILDNTVDTTTDSTKAPDNWQEYLNKAKKAGNLDDAWNYYLKTVWKENADKIKKLGSAFRIEVMYFGANELEGDKGNPFINFINYLLKPEPGITANLDMVKENAYAHIHNNFNRGYLDKNDLALILGNEISENYLGTNNVIFKSDFYNLTGKEIDELLEKQYAIKKSGVSDDDKKEVLYNNGKLRSIEDIKGFMDNKNIETQTRMTDSDIDTTSTKLFDLIKAYHANTSINQKIAILLALLGIRGNTKKEIDALVLNNYSNIKPIDTVTYKQKESDKVDEFTAKYKTSTKELAKLIAATISKLDENKELIKKENATTKA